MNHNDKSVESALKELAFLFDRYSNEARAMTQPYLLQRVKSGIRDYQYDPDDVVVREPLLEHVGSLPVVAIALYPYIDDAEVDLGKALTMLAIHDIGELLTHDEMTFKKSLEAKDPEHEAALSLLNPMYHELYEDVEAQNSSTAKFAKAIDKITPDLFELFSPTDVTLQRYKHFLNLTNPNEIIDLIESKKQPYMQWNPFMLELHKALTSQLRKQLLKG